ncbi:MAG: hypothetical protein ACXAE3_06120 [Candidatus Kariarchaeaceae archaeon]
MTLVLIVRSIEGIAIVSDSTTTVTSTRMIDNRETDVEYHIYGRQKIARIGDFAVVHAGLGFINKKTITQIVHHVKPEELTLEGLCAELKYAFEVEIMEDENIEDLDPGFMLVNLGVVGYQDDKPFVHRIIYLRSENKTELIEVIESQDTFTGPAYGIDYFGDFEFVQMMIRAAKDRGLLKPFDILTLHETLELGRTLMRFLIDFQQFMVKFTVGYPMESAVITSERGFEWIDKITLRPVHSAEDHY